jgi:pimeloyl-ACP methyl ester carboxylesterase/predicted secreted protein
MNQQRNSYRHLSTNLVFLAALGLTTLAACSDDSTADIAATGSSTVGVTGVPGSLTTSSPEASATSSSDTTASEVAERGAVVDVRLQASVPVEEVQSLLEQIQLPGLSEAQYGMAIWRVTYETVGIDGRPSTASGTIIVPEGAVGPLPVVSDQHGTQTARLSPEAPPMANEIYSAGLLFATQGYLVVGADYLGLGESSGLHPYYHADSEASAALDMLRAARSAVLDLGVEFGDELFLTGYSQGAHVTMALHRAIEQGEEFVVTASAPMAGAYDLDRVSVPMSIATPAVSTPLYLTYAVLGLDQVYGFVDDWNEVFLDSYAETAFELFDGEHEAADIVAALPADPAQLFQPAFLADLAAGIGGFAEALRANNVYDWAPFAPVRLYHGGADADVPFRNAEVASARMTELGADVQIVNVGDDLDHATASTPSYISAKAWFDSILEGS